MEEMLDDLDDDEFEAMTKDMLAKVWQRPFLSLPLRR